jgi:dimethylargininase
MRILIRNLPQSFPLSLKQDESHIIDMELAEKQHQTYVELLTKICPDIISIDHDNNYPDCCFIEDTLVSFTISTTTNNIHIITNPGAETRTGETKEIEEYMRNNFDNKNIFNIKSPGTLDGGDVLSVGNDVFIGITKRTNLDGFLQAKYILQENNTKYNVIPVNVSSLHLKSVISYLKENVLIVSDCEIGRNVYQQIEKIFPKKYKFVFIPDRTASNVLCIENNLIIQDNFPESEKIFIELSNEYNLIIHKLNMSEFIKADGALTCCSVIM